MKRIIIISVLCFLSLGYLFSQIPDGYYNGTSDLTGDALKNKLHDIIKGHKTYPYTSSSTDVWDILKESDKDPSNSNNVILFYTGWSKNGPKEFDGEKGWNREHVWAKSHGDFGTSQGPGTYCHHLRPTDITVNSKRDSRWFDEGGTIYTDPDGATTCYYDDSKYTWEPRDEVKGDVARIIFYMSTRYEGGDGYPDLEVIDYFPTNNYTKEPVHALLSTLLKWHHEDPVNDFERNRNNVVYSYQNNRNPYIDHPEFVQKIWGNPTGIRFETSQEKTVYPNPSHDFVYVNTKFKSMKYVYSITGKLILKTEENSIDIRDFDPGIYLLKTISESANDSFTYRLIKN
jgi:endonuclease I